MHNSFMVVLSCLLVEGFLPRMSFRKTQKNIISFGRSKANLAHKESSQLSIDNIFLECPICNARVFYLVGYSLKGQKESN